jgi:uncharacterized protein (DUF1499 family)
MKTIFKRLAITVSCLIAAIAALAGIEAGLGQPLGIFAGKTPQLGFLPNGRLLACPWTPNCVSSHAEVSDVKHFILPIVHTMNRDAAQTKLVSIIKAMPGAKIIVNDAGYIVAEFKSEKLGFIDDVQFFIEPGSNAVQVRSASRLGLRDLDVNRTRVESIRKQFTAISSSTAPSRAPIIIDFGNAPVAQPDKK